MQLTRDANQALSLRVNLAEQKVEVILSVSFLWQNLVSDKRVTNDTESNVKLREDGGQIMSSFDF